MAKSKKSIKKRSLSPAPQSLFDWSNMDMAFDNFRREFQNALTSFRAMPQFTPTIPTTCDVIDEGDRFVIRVDLPGVRKKDIDLNVTDNSIEISASHKEEESEKRKNYLWKERSDVSYYRILPLPEKVISGKAKAKLTDSTLNVTIPKTTPTPKPKKKSVTIQ
jgi:HSP20 family protein